MQWYIFLISVIETNSAPEFRSRLNLTMYLDFWTPPGGYLGQVSSNFCNFWCNFNWLWPLKTIYQFQGFESTLFISRMLLCESQYSYNGSCIRNHNSECALSETWNQVMLYTVLSVIFLQWSFDHLSYEMIYWKYDVWSFSGFGECRWNIIPILWVLCREVEIL